MLYLYQLLSEGEVAIIIPNQLCSICNTVVQIKNNYCSKSTFVLKVATMKNTMVPCILSSKSETYIMLLSCRLHCSMLFEKQLCNQNTHYEKYRQFLLHKGAIACYQQINTFAFSKDEWNTKEDTGKSMKNILNILWYAKRHHPG